MMTRPLPRLNIIGAGKVGKTLAKLWHDQKIFTVRGILNQNLTSARNACRFIGAGEPVSDLSPPRRCIPYRHTGWKPEFDVRNGEYATNWL